MPPDEQEPDVLKEARKDAFTHQVDLEELKASNPQPSHHNWLRQGPHYVCTSCPHTHTHYVGMDHYFNNENVTQSGSSEVPTPSDGLDGAITPKASTEPQRGRKKKGQ